MATKAPRICSNPMCHERTTGTYCPKHKPDRTAWQRRRRPVEALPKDWPRIRSAVLARDGHLCRPCLERGVTTQATEVDHVVPRSDGGTHAMTNLQAICRACHVAKTGRESHRRR